jgi:uncharacterized NAD-dependent epimerase/dehydratase family protein
MERALDDSQPETAGAIIYCESAFRSLDGKTAHGLVRRSGRYRVLAVIDSSCAGHDAGELLDGRRRGIPVVADLDLALSAAQEAGRSVSHLVVGMAPVGGRLDSSTRVAIAQAIRAGLDIDSGLHDLLSRDGQLSGLAREHGVCLRDARRPPPAADLHRFSGKIAEVGSLRVAVLGTDSGIGKRTTAWVLVDALRAAGATAELIGTGQTSWLQGARYSSVIDALPYDFVPGEIEHLVWRAWKEERPEVLVLEGQGGLLSPGYFGGQELLAAAQPELVVLQHAPGRAEYDGCPGFPIEPLSRQLEVVDVLSAAPVVALTLSRERLGPRQLAEQISRFRGETGLPVLDMLDGGGDRLARIIRSRIDAQGGGRDGLEELAQ